MWRNCLIGISIQLCEEEDDKIIEDLRGNLFGPLEFSRKNLMALIQRERDHGIPDYNSAHRAYDLPEVKHVSHFNHVDVLYICECHFQKISNKCLFTGLKAVTHFRRLKFSQFFLSIEKLHPTVNKIGVFNYGTSAITQAIDAAYKVINLTKINDVLFQHHYKSF